MHWAIPALYRDAVEECIPMHKSAALLLRHCGHELVPGKYVQTEPFIRNMSQIACADINPVMDELLSYVVH